MAVVMLDWVSAGHRAEGRNCGNKCDFRNSFTNPYAHVEEGRGNTSGMVVFEGEVQASGRVEGIAG